MKKILLLGAFAVIGYCGYAQSEEGENQSTSSGQGEAISELAKTTELTGVEKGTLISSAARAKALTQANANARFIRGEAHPENTNTTGQPTSLPTGNPTANGKPAVLPPVTPPTTGKPTVTPVGKPSGVPVGSKPN